MHRLLKIQKNQKQPDRLMIAWISFMIFGNILSIIELNKSIEELILYSDPRWANGFNVVLPLIMVMSVFSLIGLGFLIVYRKVGLYIFLVAVGVVIAINFSIGLPLPYVGFIGLGILGLLLYQNWHAMR